MKVVTQEASRAALPHVSSGLLKVFAAYTRGYVRRHFHSFRILKSGLPPRDLARPLVIFLNHASWWDPLVCLLLSREFFPDRTSFAPIDAAMLERYGFFKHLGFFGIEQQTATGARKFLRTMRAILASSRNAVWLTPQGRFMDVRERPLRLQSGLGALATQSQSTLFIPLAIEYAFWTEPRPEILVVVRRADHSRPRNVGQRPGVDQTISPTHSKQRRTNSPRAPAGAIPASGSCSIAASPA